VFTDEELKEYGEQLQRLGITDETKQKEVIEYFYQLGKIIYNTSLGCYEEKR